eukprot:Skav223732  [mRNA]  locus=scaffold424:50002:51367:- [translate_table: standard]
MCGLEPVWYVDAMPGSLQQYQALGFQAKIGGKLQAARNMALEDAASMGKPCLQLSDDLRGMRYYIERDKQEKLYTTDASCNAAWKDLKVLQVSLGAAAQWLLAKLRTSKLFLAGTYTMSGNSRCLKMPSITNTHFIMADFFVVDTEKAHVSKLFCWLFFPRKWCEGVYLRLSLFSLVSFSPMQEDPALRYDENLPIREDYDFTCQHISRFGGVVRCNRLHVLVRHYQDGGCSENRAEREKRSVSYLQKKWPGIFRRNTNKSLEDEIILKWSAEEKRAPVRKKRSNIQKARVSVLKRPSSKTAGHLTGDAFKKNKRGKIVSKKLSQAATRHNPVAKWAGAVSAARKELKIE